MVEHNFYKFKLFKHEYLQIKVKKRRQISPPFLITREIIVEECYFPYFTRNSTRRIFPEIVLGNSSKNSIIRGYLYGAVSCFT